MIEETDTIAAVATGEGASGVAVLRVSGPRALSMAGALARLPPEHLRHGQMRLRWLRAAGGERMDRGYVVAFRAPRSFTGEDVAELHVHGSPAVVDRLLAELVALGARPAGPGEFSLRAFRNGKLDLLQAEALADLVSARSEAARAQALAHLDGRLGRALSRLRAPLVEALAACEARLDFAGEQDVGDLDRPALASALSEVAARMRALCGTSRAGRLRLRGARVVIHGAPNAGKSTLFNALLGADRALVHEAPGTTRDLVEAPLEVEGMGVILVDTAGVRVGGGEVEAAGIALARRAAEAADVVLWLRDGSVPDPGLPPPGAGVVLPLRTKADLPALPGGGPAGDFGEAPAISALRPGDVERVRAMIAVALQGLARGQGRGEQVTLSRRRHAAALLRGAEATERAVEALGGGLPLELCAADLRDAAFALAELTGEVAPDDVLRAIFSRFCVGK